MTIYIGCLDNLVALAVVVDTKARTGGQPLLKLELLPPEFGRNQPLLNQRQDMATNADFIANKGRSRAKPEFQAVILAGYGSQCVQSL